MVGFASGYRSTPGQRYRDRLLSGRPEETAAPTTGTDNEAAGRFSRTLGWTALRDPVTVGGGRVVPAGLDLSR